MQIDRGYFEGWYLKQQTSAGAVAFIPAFHREKAGRTTASLQIITDERSWNVPFDTWQYERGRVFALGSSRFTPQGCHLHVSGQGISVKGSLRFSHLTPPKYDIMGPFCCIPFMQCRHSVFSLCHQVNGCVYINGTPYHFNNAPGYMEGDRGVSFPRRYLWTQCSWNAGSVMLSVADIPFLGGHFTGCIGTVYGNGIERRFATYLGARIEMISSDIIRVRQGKSVLTIRLLKRQEKPLLAPVCGGMTRTIHESLSCRVLYDLRENGREMMHFVTDRASFESVWDTNDAAP